MEIKLSDLWSILKKFFLVILVVAVLCAAASGYITKNWIREEYTTKGIYLLEPKKPSMGDVENINQHIVVAARVMTTLSVVYQTEVVMNNLLDYIDEMHEQDPTNEDYILDHTYTAKQLLGLISFDVPMKEGDYLISATVVVTAYSAHDAQVLSIAFRDICNEHIPSDYRTAYSLNPLFDTPPKGVKTAPNMTGNVCVGFLFGAVLSYALAVLLRLMNHHVYRAEDLAESFDGVPLLGQIPQIKADKRKGRGSKKIVAIKK